MWQKIETVTSVHSAVQHCPRSQTSGDVEHIQSQGQGIGSDDSDDSVGNNPRRFQRCQVRPHSQAVADWFVDANIHVSHCHGTVLLMTHSLSDCTGRDIGRKSPQKSILTLFLVWPLIEHQRQFEWVCHGLSEHLRGRLKYHQISMVLNGSSWFIMVNLYIYQLYIYILMLRNIILSSDLSWLRRNWGRVKPQAWSLAGDLTKWSGIPLGPIGIPLKGDPLVGDWIKLMSQSSWLKAFIARTMPDILLIYGLLCYNVLYR